MLHILIDNIFPDKLSGTEILHFPLNRTTKNTTAAPARLSKVNNAIITSSVYYNCIYGMLCVNKMFNSIFCQIVIGLENLSHSPNIEENITTVVLVWLLKCPTTPPQNCGTLFCI